MAKKKRAKPAESSYIDPETLYTLPGFKKASGLGHSTLFAARRRGIVLPMLTVGRRKYVRGVDAIAFIKSLAG